jgi:hypothetical protein
MFYIINHFFHFYIILLLDPDIIVTSQESHGSPTELAGYLSSPLKCHLMLSYSAQFFSYMTVILRGTPLERKGIGEIERERENTE